MSDGALSAKVKALMAMLTDAMRDRFEAVPVMAPARSRSKRHQSGDRGNHCRGLLAGGSACALNRLRGVSQVTVKRRLADSHSSSSRREEHTILHLCAIPILTFLLEGEGIHAMAWTQDRGGPGLLGRPESGHPDRDPLGARRARGLRFLRTGCRAALPSAA